MRREGFAVYMFIVVAGVSLAISTYPAEAQQANKQKQLKEVETYIANRRKAIDRHYQSQITELTLREEKHSQEVEQAEKASLDKTDLFRKTRHLDEHGFVPKDSLLSDKDVAQAKTQVEQKKKQVATRLQMGIENIEKQKQFALQKLKEFEEQLSDDVFKPKPDPTRGVVTGIVYSDEQPLALVDGQVVHKGDSVHGAKVVEILPQTVEFEKDDTRWKQRVRQSANPTWE